MPQSRPSSTHLAELISVILNPFTIAPILILRSAAVCPSRWRWIVATAQCVCALGALAVVTANRYSSLRSRLIGLHYPREDRIRPQVLIVLIAALLLMSAAGVCALPNCESERLFLIAVVVALVVAVGVTMLAKMSGHVFVLVATLVLLRIEPGILGLALWLSVPLLAWSRLTLKAHTMTECVYGLLGGAITGYASLWLTSLIGLVRWF